MNNLKRCFPFGKMKAVTLSYDDGNECDKRLIEIINKYGLKGSFHLNAMNYEDGFGEAKELYNGHEISLHSYSHPRLEHISKNEIFTQIHNDKCILEKLAGYPVTGMSYPYGTYNDDVVDLLSAAGVEYCRTTKGTDDYRIPQNLLEWHPTCHDKKLIDHSNIFVESNPKFLSLLYVWGHSHEFEKQNRWEYIDDQFSIISGRHDIWYATNIEIARYIKAMQSIIVSCNADIVYNPCAISVWVICNDKIIELKPGELTNI